MGRSNAPTNNLSTVALAAIAKPLCGKRESNRRDAWRVDDSRLRRRHRRTIFFWNERVRSSRCDSGASRAATSGGNIR